MATRDARCLAAIALLLAATGAFAAEITIYRCTDAQGRLTLRDTPCAKGEMQQTREMVRPTDPPVRPAPAYSAPAISPSPTAPAPIRVVVIPPARPMYECMAPDGERYTSETGDGYPRWVPLWTLGFPVFPRHHRFDGGSFDAHVGGRVGDSGRVDFRIGDRVGRPPVGGPHPPMRPPMGPPTHPPMRSPKHPPFVGAVFPAFTWVSDTCYPLPQQEVCSRLRDRRYELDRRYNSALQSERTRITNEQRGIDAHLSQDCGAY